MLKSPQLRCALSGLSVNFGESGYVIVKGERLISCRLDYCNSLLYNVPTHKTDRLQRLRNQCVRILIKSPRREHITSVLKSLHWLKIHDKILMLTYKSYYNIALTYLCELISRRESSVNTRLGADHHKLIMPPISKDCSNTFLER